MGDGAFGEQVSGLLTKEGYEITLIKNGLEGLKGIYDVLPHLVLLDVNLTGTDSYDLLTKKQADRMLAKIPVFLVSTQGMPISMHRIPANSVAEFIMILHPDPSEIITKVNRHFGKIGVDVYGLKTADVKNGKKIIWVEDDKLIGTILGKKLTSSGFDLILANNGEEAFEDLKRIIPDIIILDILLPGMNGFDILQKLKMDERLKKIPVMILSNTSKPSDVEKAQVLGADKYLVKAAASLDEIVGEVRKLCK